MYYLNRRPDGQEEVTVEDLKEERNDDILQHYEHLANYAEQSETGNRTSSSGTYLHMFIILICRIKSIPKSIFSKGKRQ